MYPGNIRDTVDAEPVSDGQEVEAKPALAQVDYAYDLDEKAQVADYKADAIAAENAEHNMTVLQAVREYPIAPFWAFVMSFTIVTTPNPPSSLSIILLPVML